MPCCRCVASERYCFIFVSHAPPIPPFAPSQSHDATQRVSRRNIQLHFHARVRHDGQTDVDDAQNTSFLQFVLGRRMLDLRAIKLCFGWLRLLLCVEQRPDSLNRCRHRHGAGQLQMKENRSESGLIYIQRPEGQEEANELNGSTNPTSSFRLFKRTLQFFAILSVGAAQQHNKTKTKLTVLFWKMFGKSLVGLSVFS